MKNYKIVREPYYVSNESLCCQEDIGMWHLYYEGEIVSWEGGVGNIKPVSFGYEDEVLYYILKQNGINVEKEEKYD